MTEMWLTISERRMRPASLSSWEGAERSRVLTFVHENGSSVKNSGDRVSRRKVPRLFAWMQLRK